MCVEEPGSAKARGGAIGHDCALAVSESQKFDLAVKHVNDDSVCGIRGRPQARASGCAPQDLPVPWRAAGEDAACGQAVSRDGRTWPARRNRIHNGMKERNRYVRRAWAAALSRSDWDSALSVRRIAS